MATGTDAPTSRGPAAKTKANPDQLQPISVTVDWFGESKTFPLRFNSYALRALEDQSGEKISAFFSRLNYRNPETGEVERHVGISDMLNLLRAGLEGGRFEGVMRGDPDARREKFTEEEACVIADGMGGVMNSVNTVMEAFTAAFPDEEHQPENESEESGGEENPTEQQTGKA